MFYNEVLYKLKEDHFLLLYPVKKRKAYKGFAVVYCLIDPRDESIRYIGKSVNGINRAFEHCKPGNLKTDGNTRKANWIRSLLQEGLKPLVYVIDYFPLDIDKNIKNDYIYQKEHKYINYFKELGLQLYNATDGGKGAIGRIVSEETRIKMSVSAKKRKLPEALIKRHCKKYGPPAPKYLYYKKKPKKGTYESYQNSLKKQVIGRNLTTNIEITFKSINDCERYFKGISDTKKFNRRWLRRSIKLQIPYYGYIWSWLDAGFNNKRTSN